MSKWLVGPEKLQYERKVYAHGETLEVPDGTKLSITCCPLDAAALDDYKRFWPSPPHLPPEQRFRPATPSAVELGDMSDLRTLSEMQRGVPNTALVSAHAEIAKLKAELAAARGEVAEPAKPSTGSPPPPTTLAPPHPAAAEAGKGGKPRSSDKSPI